MKRSHFITRAGALSVAANVPHLCLAADGVDTFQPSEGSWRTFKLTTIVTLQSADTPVRAWIPVPGFVESDWMRPGATTWETNATSSAITRAGDWGVKILYAQWNKPTAKATITVTSTVSTSDRSVNLSRPGNPTALPPGEYRLYTSSTKLLPTDGVVAATARRIVGNASSDLQKAKLIYDWVVASSSRNPKTRGCGLGNVSFMLETGDLSGKCADINGLYVALVRAAGIPARDLYGIRVAPSRFGYKSLGANYGAVTKAQHCRSEVHLTDYGWVPVDAADVRKVMLEEPPGHLLPNDPKVINARDTLFGSWEGNYIVYNDGHDVTLPGSAGPDVGFFMYPQAEIQGQPRDSLSPDDFIYTIQSEQPGS